MSDLTPILETRAVSRSFRMGGRGPHRNRVAQAVDQVDIWVGASETLGIVGESGCGKTTLARMLLRLIEPTEGQVLFHGTELRVLDRQRTKKYREAVQAVFQDPASSLNPRMRVGSIVAEPMQINEDFSRAEIRERVNGILNEVGLEPGADTRYPHEFSGGQKQRIGIARALSCNPELVILDEPVSSLDVSFKAQLLNLLLRLQESRNLSYVFIAHDLAAVRYLFQRVAVMYLGEVVETGSAEDLFDDPLHPYTQLLLAATLTGERREKRTTSVARDDIPSPFNPPSGCRFRTRCPFAFDRCTVERPRLQEVRPGRRAACHLLDANNLP
jgi:oligopeptide/dipeptide ABC transporter ATP-binding protein